MSDRKTTTKRPSAIDIESMTPQERRQLAAKLLRMEADREAADHAAEAQREAVAHAKREEPLPRYLTREAAAKLLNLSVGCLDLWRYQNNPDAPPYIRCGARRIAYDSRDLQAWCEANRVGSFPLDGSSER